MTTPSSTSACPATAVPTAAHGDGQAVLAGEAQRGGDVGSRPGSGR